MVDSLFIVIISLAGVSLFIKFPKKGAVMKGWRSLDREERVMVGDEEKSDYFGYEWRVVTEKNLAVGSRACIYSGTWEFRRRII